jgi:hypothetical protein
MTGGALIGLILLSMAWMFYLGGSLLKFIDPGKKDSPVARLGFLPGAIGSLAVFFSLPYLLRRGVDVPWPWFWILLPLALDLVVMACRRRRPPCG